MPLLSTLSSVPWVQILGALVVVLTGVHSLFLLLGKVWAPALKVAEVTGVVAVDLQQVFQWLPGGGLAKKVGPIAILALLVGCTPAARAGIPVLSQVDAIGIGVSHVLGWCEERGIEPATVMSAKQAVAAKDYALALDLVSRVVTASRKAGDPIPEEVEVTLRLAEGAMAAQAVEDGMRTVSTAKDAGAP